MIPEAFSTSDLLAELVRRDAIRILQTTQRIEGVKLMMNLGQTDDLRAFSIGMAQRMAAIELQNNVEMQHVTHRKLKTSNSEEVMVTFAVVTGAAIKELVAKPAEQLEDVGFEYEDVPL
jgi:hypothetical protein